MKVKIRLPPRFAKHAATLYGPRQPLKRRRCRARHAPPQAGHPLGDAAREQRQDRQACGVGGQEALFTRVLPVRRRQHCQAYGVGGGRTARPTGWEAAALSGLWVGMRQHCQACGVGGQALFTRVHPEGLRPESQPQAAKDSELWRWQGGVIRVGTLARALWLGHFGQGTSGQGTLARELWPGYFWPCG